MSNEPNDPAPPSDERASATSPHIVAPDAPRNPARELHDNLVGFARAAFLAGTVQAHDRANDLASASMPAFEPPVQTLEQVQAVFADWLSTQNVIPQAALNALASGGESFGDGEPSDDEITAEPLLQLFRWRQLPPVLANVSRKFCTLARIVARLPRNPERSASLRKLRESKDTAVTAVLWKDPAQPNTPTMRAKLDDRLGRDPIAAVVDSPLVSVACSGCHVVEDQHDAGAAATTSRLEIDPACPLHGIRGALRTEPRS